MEQRTAAGSTDTPAIQRDIEISRRRVAADIEELSRRLDGRAILRRALRRAAIGAAVITAAVTTWVVVRRKP
jgi:hypothetical protein